MPRHNKERFTNKKPERFYVPKQSNNTKNISRNPSNLSNSRRIIRQTTNTRMTRKPTLPITMPKKPILGPKPTPRTYHYIRPTKKPIVINKYYNTGYYERPSRFWYDYPIVYPIPVEVPVEVPVETEKVLKTPRKIRHNNRELMLFALVLFFGGSLLYLMGKK